jgi:putrescine transport system permease protein
MKKRIYTLWKGYQQAFHQQRHLVTAIPYTWLFLFFLIPFLIIFKISLYTSTLSAPPFEALFYQTEPGFLTVRLNFNHYLNLIRDSIYLRSFFFSLGMAAAATFCCLLLGYGMAYGLSKVSFRWRHLLVLMIILPFWTSFLIRVYAWMNLLGTQGVINQFLMWLGLIEKPLPLLYNTFSVLIGLIYCYLPFMILPIYVSLIKINTSYLEAAYDLGCRPRQAFWGVIFPLSVPGMMAGCVLVFIPAVGEFIIPELLGAPDTLMIGRILWMEFFTTLNWPQACAVAAFLLVVFVTPIMLFQRYQMRTVRKTV